LAAALEDSYTRNKGRTLRDFKLRDIDYLAEVAKAEGVYNVSRPNNYNAFFNSKILRDALRNLP
jgi:hypothetical protein